MKQLPNETALLLIDVQKGFADPRWGKRNNPNAEKRMADLLAFWRKMKRPVLHVQHLSSDSHSPLHPDGDGIEFQDGVKPLEGEPVFKKTVNSAFIGTDLEGYLKRNGINALVIAGLTTNHCVSTTTRMAGNLGFDTYIVEDATATFDRIGHDGKFYSAETIHDTALTSLHEEFAIVVSTDELLQS